MQRHKCANDRININNVLLHPQFLKHFSYTLFLPYPPMFFETASPAYSFHTDDDLALLPAQTRNINNLQLPSELSYRTARHKKSVCVFLCSSFLSYLTWQVTMPVHVYHFIGKKAECVTRNTVSPFSQRLSILMMLKNINGFSILRLLDFVSI